MFDLNLFDRLVYLVSRHPVLALIVAFVLGLNAPAGVRRFARWTVVFVFWLAVLIYLLPVGAVGFALYVVGIRVVPSDDDLPPASAQLWLPFER
jgi:protein-S-isoprenylcysteine O-methyltransferase Ste14